MFTSATSKDGRRWPGKSGDGDGDGVERSSAAYRNGTVYTSTSVRPYTTSPAKPSHAIAIHQGNQPTNQPSKQFVINAGPAHRPSRSLQSRQPNDLNKIPCSARWRRTAPAAKVRVPHLNRPVAVPVAVVAVAILLTMRTLCSSGRGSDERQRQRQRQEQEQEHQLLQTQKVG